MKLTTYPEITNYSLINSSLIDVYLAFNQANSNASKPITDKAFTEYFGYVNNALRQIILVCKPQDINHSFFFNMSLNVLDEVTKNVLTDTLPGESPKILVEDNFKIYTENINSISLINKTIYIDENTPLIIFGPLNNLLATNFSTGEPSYSIRYIYWNQSLLRCAANISNNDKISNVFIQIEPSSTNNITETNVNKTTFKILYPSSLFNESNYQCDSTYFCTKKGLVNYNNKTYYDCDCDNLDEFNDSNQLVKIFSTANFQRIIAYETFQNYEFYKSIIFYLNVIWLILTFIFIIWGWRRDKFDSTHALRNIVLKNDKGFWMKITEILAIRLPSFILRILNYLNIIFQACIVNKLTIHF